MFSQRTNWNREENELSRKLAELRLSGTPILDLAKSNPTECGFRYDEAGIHRAFAQADVTRYQPDPRGLESARAAVSKYYADLGAKIGTDELILTSGTSEGYSFLFRLLCNAGDEVLIPAPGYPLFDFLVDLCDVKLVRYPLVYHDGWQIDFAGLAAAATSRTQAVIVVHPNNPTAHYMTEKERTQLLDFCRSRGLALISDEVFLDFAAKPNEALHRSFAGAHETLTFALSGLSKICGLPQMKLAWIAVSGPEQEKTEALARLEIISDAYLSVGTPVQLGACDLLATRARFQAEAMQRISNNLRELDRQLSLQSACTRLHFAGGWTAVLRVPALQTDEELALALLEKGVHVHAGHFYDFAQSGHLVISLIVPEEDLAEGARRILSHFS
jgi:aspartate/methionine/tyrosine aminotransferase